MECKILISPEAIKDIQETIDWYNDKKKGLGESFHKETRDSFKILRGNPFFAIRYDNIRCLKLKKFPYLIHFILDEKLKIITVLGVLNTYLNPDEHWFLEN